MFFSKLIKNPIGIGKTKVKKYLRMKSKKIN
jgi:hypothetical protein